MSESKSSDGGDLANEVTSGGLNKDATKTDTSTLYYMTKVKTEMASNLGHYIAAERISECLQPLTDIIDRLQKQEAGQDALANRLRGLVNHLRARLGNDSLLRDDAIVEVLRPLDEFIENTRELAELDHVHTELESKIIKPVERAQARASMLSVLFGAVGLIAAIISIIGLLFSWNSQGEQEVLVAMQKELVKAIQERENVEEGNLELLINAIQNLGEDIKRQPSGLPSAGTSESSLSMALLGQPRRALEIAFATGNSELAYAAAKQIIGGSYGIRAEVEAATIAVVAGAPEAINLINEVWDKHKSDLPPEETGLLAGGAVQYYERKDEPEKGESLVSEMVEHVVTHSDSSSEHKAFVWNQLGKLTSDYDPERAKGYQLRAIEQNQSEPSYHYNLSIIYESLEQIDEAIASAEEAIQRQGDEKDGDHYCQAIDVYLRRLETRGSTDNIVKTQTEIRLRELLQELQDIDPDLLRLQLVTKEALRGLAP